MADSTYKVQKGDTLSGIAAKLGVKASDISGYKSGNPDLIYAGETLSVGSKPQTDAGTYASAVKDGLSGDSYGSSSTDTSKSPTSIYDSSKLASDRDTYKSSLDTAKTNLEKAQKDAWDTEYNASGLADTKAKMAQLDSDIAAERQKRDDAIAKVRSNPGLSAAQMTGDIKKLADYQNNIINNKINERNGLASEYNAGLDTIDRKVASQTAAAQTEYNYYAGLLSDTEKQLGDYQTALTNELANQTQSDQFDRQLAQALEIAKMNASKSGSSGSNLQLAKDPNTGDPLYWFDPDTGAITYINGNNGGGGSSSDGFDALGSQDSGGTADTTSSSSQPGYFGRLFNALLGRSS